VKPLTKTSNVVTGGMESQAFTIKASGKAFRILIDGIYSNKILAPVRELMSNAFDAHSEAGNPETAFDVIVPTTMDPTFGVRDYGTGMTHEQVMGLYTTLFDSSRESSNNAVGMLGLGSKSPFAYTDSFTVSSYDGSDKRTYMAYIQSDVPMISLVGTVPSTASRGLDVRFPVKQSDVGSFIDAVRSVALGFDVYPKFDTDATITFPTPTLVGESWRLFTSAEMPVKGMGRQDHILRQGCVTYPVPNSRHSHSIPYGMTLIVDVPIGTVDVATSREALSFDDETRVAVSDAFDSAWNSAQAQITDTYNNKKTQFDRLTYAASLGGDWRSILPKHARQLMFNMMPEELTSEEKQNAVDDYSPGKFVLDTKKKVVTSLNFSHLSACKFIIDCPDVVRRRSRIVECGRNNPRVFVIPMEMDQTSAIKMMKRDMGLKDENFIKVQDLPDNHTPRAAAGPRTKISVKKDAIANGDYWVIRSRSTYTMPGTSCEEVRSLYLGLGSNTVGTLLVDRFWEKSMVFLTPKEYEKISPPISQSYGKVVLDAAVLAHSSDIVLQSIQSQTEAGLRKDAVTWEAANALVQHIAPQPKNSKWFNQNIKNFLDSNNSVNYDGISEGCRATVDLARKNYPRLFNLKGWSMTDYISDQDHNQTKEDKTS
jgi:hypothetical protein